MVPKPDKGNPRKEDCRPLALININAKVLNKILAKRIQEHIKKTIHYDQVVFIPRMQGWFNIHKSINVIYHINKMKNKSHDHLKRQRKSFYKIKHPFMIKPLRNWV